MHMAYCRPPAVHVSTMQNTVFQTATTAVLVVVPATQQAAAAAAMEAARAVGAPPEACTEILYANRMRMNRALGLKLEAHFKPLGIAAFTCCCRYRCTDTYAEDDPAFDEISRDQGIYFMRFNLDGMNYNETPEGFYAFYQDFDFLMQEWESEKELLVKWCTIIGLKPSEYTIDKPENAAKGIHVSFSKPFSLEPIPQEVCGQCGETSDDDGAIFDDDDCKADLCLRCSSAGGQWVEASGSTRGQWVYDSNQLPI